MGGLTAMVLDGESDESLASAIVLVDIAPKAEQKVIERIFAFMSSHLESSFGSLEEAAAAVSAYLPQRSKNYDPSRLEKNLGVFEKDGIIVIGIRKCSKCGKMLRPTNKLRTKNVFIRLPSG